MILEVSVGKSPGAASAAIQPTLVDRRGDSLSRPIREQRDMVVILAGLDPTADEKNAFSNTLRCGEADSFSLDRRSLGAFRTFAGPGLSLPSLKQGIVVRLGFSG